jgi:hypothetical protein
LPARVPKRDGDPFPFSPINANVTIVALDDDCKEIVPYERVDQTAGGQEIQQKVSERYQALAAADAAEADRARKGAEEQKVREEAALKVLESRIRDIDLKKTKIKGLAREDRPAHQLEPTSPDPIATVEGSGPARQLERAAADARPRQSNASRASPCGIVAEFCWPTRPPSSASSRETRRMSLTKRTNTARAICHRDRAETQAAVES